MDHFSQGRDSVNAYIHATHLAMSYCVRGFEKRLLAMNHNFNAILDPNMFEISPTEEKAPEVLVTKRYGVF